ncbi:MAG: hypothetical protein HUJ91_02540 [Bacteroidales bacterium]|nr:hypothetical protein [Bacteroidales bacterium]
MKHYSLLLSLFFVSFGTIAACDDYQQQIDALQEKIDTLENGYSEANASLEALVRVAGELGDGQKSRAIVPALQDGKVTGYAAHFASGSTVTVWNQTCGISITAVEGTYCWALDGKPIMSNGNIIPITDNDAALQMRIVDSNLEISLDGGSSWNGQGVIRRSPIDGISEDNEGYTITLADNGKIFIAKESYFGMELEEKQKTLTRRDSALTLNYSLSQGAQGAKIHHLSPDGITVAVSPTDGRSGILTIVAVQPAADTVVSIIASDNFGHTSIRQISVCIDRKSFEPQPPSEPDEPDEPELPPFLEIEQTEFETECDAIILNIPVSTNAQLTIKAIETGDEYGIDKSERTYSDGVLTVSIPRNPYCVERHLKYSLSIGVKSAKIDIYQSGRRYTQYKNTNYTLHSDILNADIPYTVVYPSNIDDAEGRIYPVVYLLHGLGGNNRTWTDGYLIKTKLNQMVRSGKCREMILVCPCAGGEDIVNVQNGYYNIDGWRYEDFFFNELVPEVEQAFHIVSHKDYRAIAGFSMGGGGTIGYCQHHPGMFCALWAVSPWCSALSDIMNEFVTNEVIGENKLIKVNDSVRENDLIEFLKNAPEETVESLKTIDWSIETGRSDFILFQTQGLVQALSKRDIPYTFLNPEGEHLGTFCAASMQNCLPHLDEVFARLQ